MFSLFFAIWLTCFRDYERIAVIERKDARVEVMRFIYPCILHREMTNFVKLIPDK